MLNKCQRVMNITFGTVKHAELNFSVYNTIENYHLKIVLLL